jgi:hypothetical protein
LSRHDFAAAPRDLCSYRLRSPLLPLTAPFFSMHVSMLTSSACCVVCYCLDHVQVQRRFNNAASVYRGPLLYSVGEDGSCCRLLRDQIDVNCGPWLALVSQSRCRPVWSRFTDLRIRLTRRVPSPAAQRSRSTRRCWRSTHSAARTCSCCQPRNGQSACILNRCWRLGVAPAPRLCVLRSSHPGCCGARLIMCVSFCRFLHAGTTRWCCKRVPRRHRAT